MKAKEADAMEHKVRKIMQEPGYIEEAAIIMLKLRNISAAADAEHVMLMPSLLSMVKKSTMDIKGKTLLHISITFKLFPVR